MSKTKLVVCWVELYKYVEVPADETDAETLHRVKNEQEKKNLLRGDKKLRAFFFSSEDLA